MGMSAAPSGGKKARPAPIINVTPLVDVVLCVLIIFMIVTTMMTRTFWMNIPKSEKKDAEQAQNDLKPLVLTVDKAGVIRANQTVLTKPEVQGRVYIGDRPVNIVLLEEQVRALTGGRPDAVVYLRADEGLRYGQVIKVVDVIKHAGVDRIGFVYVTPQEKQP